MLLPNEPVTLTPEQIAELNSKLSKMRHDINNYLALIIAAAELIRFKPDSTERMLNTIAEQPQKITAYSAKFCAEFEKTFGIKRN